MNTKKAADLILHNGHITTLDPNCPEAKNVAIKDGRIVGVDDAESYERGPNTTTIDLKGRRVIPGLNDSHLHVIRGGLNYNMELRWDGVPSLADALRMLREQAQRTPPGQWVRVGGGWSEFQFAERRMPTLEEMHRRGEMTLRMAYNLFPQKPKQEKEDFARWIKMTGPGKGDDFFRCNGAGEMLVFSAADFEDFLEPRPNLPSSLEIELKDVVMLLAANKWPFRIHATYDESINRFLNVYEEVNRDVPFKGLNWFFDHCETISDRNLERVKALGGGIAIQHRMAYQGEYFIDRYGKKAAERTPPVRKMLELGIPVGAGTDATRVASYNPCVSLYWLVTGKTVGGTALYSEANRLSREEALMLYTKGSSWFSGESGKKGAIVIGQLADVTALTEDYMSVAEEKIKGIESVLTIVGGKIVYAVQEFQNLDPAPLPVLPDWSPIKLYGGYGAPLDTRKAARAGVPMPQHQHNAECHHHGCAHAAHQLLAGIEAARNRYAEFWGLGCDCFAF